MHVYVSGTADAIMMVEAGANEVSEDIMLGGILYAHEEIKKQVAFINEIVAQVGKPKRQMELYHVPEDLDAAVREYGSSLIDKALEETNRQARQEKQEEVEKQILEHFADIYPEMEREIKDSIYYITKEKVRAKILNDGFPSRRKKVDRNTRYLVRSWHTSARSRQRSVYKRSVAGFDHVYAGYFKRSSKTGKSRRRIV